MTMLLRQATSASIMLGPFVSSDGVGLVSLTISPQLIRLSKNGAGYAALNLTASNAIHNENAYYSIIFDNTDTGSLGRLSVACSVAAAIPFFSEYTVLPTSVYDGLILGSTLQQVALGATVISSAAFASSGIQRMANLLSVDMSSISVPINARSPVNALRILRNRVTTSGQLVVYGEDDVTAVWTGAVTAAGSASLITEIDPN